MKTYSKSFVYVLCKNRESNPGLNLPPTPTPNPIKASETFRQPVAKYSVS